MSNEAKKEAASPETSNDLVSLGKVDGWAEDEVRRVEGDDPIAVYNSGGEFFATSDWCSHDKASLAEGWLEDGVIECPWHLAKFCIKTGKALSSPAKVDLKCFKVFVENGEVFVETGLNK